MTTDPFARAAPCRRALLLTGVWLAATGAGAVTPGFAAGERVGTNRAAALTEASGLVAGVRNPGVLWAHNDSGNSARVFALSTDGALLGTYSLSGAGAVDWEDMAAARDPSNGVAYLYLGDIGDNAAGRSSIAVYRVPEPAVDTNVLGVVASLPDVTRYPLVYADGARDAETLLVDPANGDLVVVSKRDIPSRIYRLPAPFSPAVTNVLAYTGSLTWGWAVAGDVGPSGRQVLLKGYANVSYYERPDGVPLHTALRAAPAALPYTLEPQGEAIAWAAGEQGYYTLSEGSAQPIYAYASTDADDDGLSDAAEVAIGTGIGDPDSDDDDQSDGDEVFTGMDPLQRTSVFAVAASPGGTGSIELRWPAIPGRLYDVLENPALPGETAATQPVVSNLAVGARQVLSTNLVPDVERAQYLIRVR